MSLSVLQINKTACNKRVLNILENTSLRHEHQLNRRQL